jgi:hypothetical protein
VRLPGRGQGAAAALAAALMVLCGRGAALAAEPSLAERLWIEIARRLDRASPPAAPPPVPIAVTWRARQLAAIDFAAPLLALRAVDIDGDGPAELVAVTAAELRVMRVVPGGPAAATLARAALVGAPAVIAPREPGATAVATRATDGSLTIAARLSALAAGGLWQMRAGSLERLAETDGFVLCPGVRAELAPGRNYFAGPSVQWAFADWAAPAVPERFYTLACRDDLRGPDGHRYGAAAAVDDAGRLHVWQFGPRAQVGTVKRVGAALALADVDNDGALEVITTADVMPGRSDRVRVYTFDTAALRLVHETVEFDGAVVAVAAGDLDGDRAVEVVAAVRAAGSTVVELWILN